jgi:hypothetical protein
MLNMSINNQIINTPTGHYFSNSQNAGVTAVGYDKTA